jgi:hypothetical protein
MRNEGIQIQQIIAGKLRRRHLDWLEVREIWYTFRELRRCAAMTAFIRHLQEDTVPHWKKEIAAWRMAQVPLQSLFVWMNSEPNFKRLYEKSVLERYVGITKNADPERQEKSLEEWVEETAQLLPERKLEVPKDDEGTDG